MGKTRYCECLLKMLLSSLFVYLCLDLYCIDRYFQDIFNGFYYQILFCPWLFYRNHRTVVQWCRRRAWVHRVQAHREMFWFGENPGKCLENQGKIYGNLCKICENLREIPEYFEKNGPQRVQNHIKTFLEVIPKDDLFEKMNTEKIPQIFPSSLGKLGQRYFAPTKIRLLLHLSYTMYISWDSNNRILKQGMQIGTTY